ncbi:MULTISPECIES: LysR family transcriptional regulator [unclassified Agrobacterium]|uniref:LysR family transcriptional regulator n=1 Tax=unclassified Agrobacterium TaxID=2632611 RepID=UPI0024499450|nr:MULTISPECIES: LysR family transcriptional regulator [unclassified Agrobacterium]MDH0615755.1 LysR family transcriptional regulator [Agrobacterium sp. GD03872]MDH0697891.1 LysR family transcriptional regulator [Agrobacterium sp. GD03871]MDH1061688.1 LysR family transcriptional regulator [Agrobacterium sp. GD03992]MDH2211147.1 LysR family transcriptional regulator [Agrobacterium sp. GD03643]MDH2221707.1 LysR family transcriptional regulator [Agrobacterium sp. GD03638]
MPVKSAARRSVPPLDMNLLVTLDALLSEGSVVGAAQRLNLSAPAMSRQLSRIRHLLGDPILVRAGRGLVPTPRAENLRERLRRLVTEAETLVRGEDDLNLFRMERTFVIRANDGFVGTFGAALASLAASQAPQVRLRFAHQDKEDVEALREGRIDADVGVIGAMGPEIRLQALFHDRFIGVVRLDHPMADAVTPEGFAAFPHVSVSRRGRFAGPIDEALSSLGLKRFVAIAVANFADALAIVRTSDHVAAVPARLTEPARADLHSFELPVKTDALAISLAWHPRFDADPAHRWLRGIVREACMEKRLKPRIGKAE